MKYLKRLILFVFCAVLSLGLLSCGQKQGTSSSTDSTDSVTGVSFSFSKDEVSGTTQTSRQLFKPITTIDPSAKYAVVSIKDSSGNTVVSQKKLDIYELNNSYITGTIVLGIGTYQVTEFFILDANDKVIYIVPTEVANDDLKRLVSKPLPISFSVTKNSTNSVSLQVLKPNTNTASDFGYPSVAFNIVNYIKLMVIVQILDSNTGWQLATSSLKVNNVDYNIPAQTATVLIAEADTYKLDFSKGGYGSTTITLTKDEIKGYETSPLVVNLSSKGTTPPPIAIWLDDFNNKLLDTSWQVIEKVPGRGRYSLTDNTGYLRYYLEGSRSYAGGWRNNYQASGGWDPSLTLIRPFDGENWTLKTKVNYNLRANSGCTAQSCSTGAQYQSFWIAFGKGTNDYLQIYRGVDWWYSSNTFTIELVSNGVSVANFKGTPSSVGADGWVRESYWYKITRNGEKITVRFSNDGINYNTAFSALITKPVTTTQRAIIDMSLWNGVGSYVDWDYIHVEPAPMEIVIFDDQFKDPKLGSDWVISPGRGSYSLTDNPGYLRYIIDANHTARIAGSGQNYAQSLWLVRPFSGDRWILKTAITYNMRPGSPTNNRNMHFRIRTPEVGNWNFTNIAYIGRGVGVHYDSNMLISNSMSLSAGTNTNSQNIYLPPSPDPLPLDRWYVEIERNKDHVVVRVSNDGNDSTFEYEKESTLPPGLGNDQVIEINGDGWYGSNNPAGYVDFDFIRVNDGTNK